MLVRYTSTSVSRSLWLTGQGDNLLFAQHPALLYTATPLSLSLSPSPLISISLSNVIFSFHMPAS